MQENTKVICGDCGGEIIYDKDSIKDYADKNEANHDEYPKFCGDCAAKRRQQENSKEEKRPVTIEFTVEEYLEAGAPCTVRDGIGLIREVEETALYRTLRAPKVGETVTYCDCDDDDDIRAVGAVSE